MMAVISDLLDSWTARIDLDDWSGARLLDLYAFRASQRDELYEYVAGKVGNGVTVKTALSQYQADLLKMRARRTARIVGEVAQRVGNGTDLHKALRGHAPPDELMMIAAGEHSGTLPKELDELVETRDSIAEMRQVMISALVTPMVYVLTVYGVLLFIGLKFLPSMASLGGSASYHGWGELLVVLGVFVTGSLWLVPPLVLASLVGLVVYSLPRWTGRTRRWAESYYPWNYYRDVRGYTWLLGYTAMIRAGLPEKRILLEQAAHSTPWLRERLDAIRSRLENGGSFGEAVLKSGFVFPHRKLMTHIASGDGFSDFPDRMGRQLHRWFGHYKRSTNAKMQIMAVVYEFLTLGLITVIVLGFTSLSYSVAGSFGV